MVKKIWVSITDQEGVLLERQDIEIPQDTADVDVRNRDVLVKACELGGYLLEKEVSAALFRNRKERTGE